MNDLTWAVGSKAPGCFLMSLVSVVAHVLEVNGRNVI